MGELGQCDVHLDHAKWPADSEYLNSCLFHEVCCHLRQTKCEHRLMQDHVSNDVECRYFVRCEFSDHRKK